MPHPPQKRKRIIILGIYPTQDILKRPEIQESLQKNFCAIISIIEPDANSTRPFHEVGASHWENLLEISFGDFNQETSQIPEAQGKSPTREDVEKIIHFLHARLQTKGRIFIHCHAGHSRSPAVAIIADYLVQGDPVEAVRHIQEDIQPGCEPNPLLLELADEILGLTAPNNLLTNSQKKTKNP